MYSMTQKTHQHLCRPTQGGAKCETVAKTKDKRVATLRINEHVYHRHLPVP